MKHLVVVAILAVAVTACGRADPRLHKLTVAQGNSTTTTRFDYDSAGHPATVTLQGGDFSDTLTFTWKDGHATRIESKTVAVAGTFTATDVTDLTYDGDKLKKAETNLADSSGTRTVNVSYDDGGHLASIDTHEVRAGNQTSDSSVTVTRGSSGVDKVVLESGNNKQTFDVTYKDGAIETLDVAADGNTGTATASYKDGKLDRFDFSGTDSGSGNTVHSQLTYDYDKQGRMSHVLSTQDNNPDTDIDLEYDDGDAADIDMVPSSVSVFLLWDLKGAAFNDIDVRTQVVRFAGAQW